MAQLRPKIVKLAKIIGGVTGITTKIDENAPEYYCMAGILSDDEADIAIAAGLRKERTAGYLAKKVGKTVEEVQPLLDNLVYYGIFRRSMDKALGEDVYYMQIFAPGILEMMVNQKELLETHPEVGRAFDEYTRNLAASMGAMIPDGYGLMRVIPVESALEGIEGVSDYERISHYLDKYDRFSVSPCSCRASRSSLGRRLRPPRGGYVRADGQRRRALHPHRPRQGDHARAGAGDHSARGGKRPHARHGQHRGAG